jgi:hypothetical protein
MDDELEKIRTIDCACGWVAWITYLDDVHSVWALLDDHLALRHSYESNGEAGASSTP